MKNKKKIEVYLTEEWRAKVQKHAKFMGISLAEVLRRSLAEYLK
jgi:hypothetical protein